MRTGTLSVLICILVFPISIVYAGDPLSVIDAWVLEAPPGMKVMAAYMTLKNISDNNYELKAVSSPEFERVEMHHTIIEHDQARMEKQNTMTVQAGNTLKFEPGGNHLMLINPKKSLRRGDDVVLSLIFNQGNKLDVIAQVRKRSEKLNTEHDN